MKFSAILGKRQVVLATLIFALSIAIYLNWQFSNSGEGFDITGALTSSKNLGDAQFVGNTSEDSDNSTASMTSTEYFNNARLSRQLSRDHALEVLKSVVDDETADADAKNEAVAAVAQIAKNITLEDELETLIKAKGFEDCVVTIEANQITAAVKTEGLVQSEVMQIRDIIIGNTDFKTENIKVFEVK